MAVRLGVTLLMTGVGMVMPVLLMAQTTPATGLSENIQGLQATLAQVYQTMMAQVGELMGVGQQIAAYGALFYISYRVWGHIARAESIDFFPLFRPFVISLVISIYPSFIDFVNFLLAPTVSGTAVLVTNANASITMLLQQEQAMIDSSAEWQMYVGADGEGSEEKWEQYSGQAETGAFSGLSNALEFQLARISYNFHNAVKTALSQIMELVYQAAALCINTLRTFNMVLLAILGPIVLGLSVWDGFKHLLTAWLGRYINVFLWLPVAQVFGSLCGQIQIAMLKYDLQNFQATGQTSFGQTDAAYLIFLLIASIGYFCVPSITNHIINVHPSGGGAMLQKVSGAPQAAAGMVASVAKATATAGAEL